LNPLLGIFVTGLSARIFMISLPTLAHGLQTDILGVTWALISFQIAGICGSVIFGRLGDIYGHRTIYGLGVIMITAGSLLCGVSQNVLQMIVFRFVQGLGGAIIQSAGRALALEAVPPGSEGKAQGFMATAHHAGFFLGPPLGGLIIELIDWRGIFFLVVPAGLAAIFLTYRTTATHSAAPSRRQPVDYGGTFLFILLTAIVTLVLDHKAGQLFGAGSRGILTLVLAATIWGFVAHENRIQNPMINFSLFKIRTFTLSVIGLMAMNMAHGLTGFIMPFYLQDTLHISPTFMGLIFLLPSIFTLTLAPVGGHITDRIGPRTPLIIGSILLMIGLGIGVFLQPGSHWIFPAASLGITGIAGAFFNTPVQAAIISSVTKEQRGLAAGIINTIFGLGHLVGVSAGKLLLTVAFQSYSGIPDAIPTPGDPLAFVFSMNATYLASLAVCLVALTTSFKTGKLKR
jgi:EmrB/QacA subfamily drug resistance transporter